MTLAPPRLLNLFYSRMVDGITAESRAALDAALTGDYSLLAALQDNTAPASRPAQTARRAAFRAPRGKDGRHVPGTAPDHIPPPSWWRGDRSAFRSSVAAGQQLGEPAARREPPMPVIGTAQLAGVGG